MALAALFSGLALANAGLGAVHGFAAPIGGMFPAPHGAVCAALLPHVMEVNLRALRERAPDSEALRRYDEVARVLTGQPQARAEDGVGWVRTLCAELQVQPLRFWGVRPDHFALLSDRAAAASSMKANPIVLTAQERLEILQRAT
jgi:alcohol dehydrogenase class IV